MGLYALQQCLKILLPRALLKVVWGSNDVDGWVGQACSLGSLDLIADWGRVRRWWEFGWVWWLAYEFDRHRTVLRILQPQVGGKCVGKVLTMKEVAALARQWCWVSCSPLFGPIGT